MTVQELIDKLQEIPDKNRSIFLDAYDVNIPIDIIAEIGTQLVLSSNDYDSYITIRE